MRSSFALPPFVIIVIIAVEAAGCVATNNYVAAVVQALLIIAYRSVYTLLTLPLPSLVFCFSVVCAAVHGLCVCCFQNECLKKTREE